MEPTPRHVDRSWMPITAGILSIIAGAIGFIAGTAVVSVGKTVGTLTGLFGLGAIGAPLIAIGIVAIIGGIFAIRRRIWGLALAGAICALFPPPVIILGILAIIFVAMGKNEFD